MSGKADGSVIIDTELDNTGFEKGSDRLINAIESLQKSVDTMGDTMADGFNSAIKALQALSSQSTTAGKKIAASSQQAVTANQRITESAEAAGRATQNITPPQKLSSEYSSIEKSAASLQDRITRLQTAAEIGFKNDGQILRFRDNVDIISRKVGELRARLNTLGSTKIPTYQYTWLTNEIAKAEEQLKNLYDKQVKMDDTGVKKSSAAYQRLQYDIEQTKRKLDEYNNEMANMSDSEKFTLGIDTSEYSSAFSLLGSLEGKLAGVQQASAAAAANLKNVPQSVNGTAASIPILSTLDSLVMKAQGGFASFKTSAAGAAGAITGFVKAHPAVAVVATAAQKAGSAFKKMGAAIKKLALAAAKKAIQGLGNALRSTVQLAKQAASAIGGGLVKALKSIGASAKNAVSGLFSFGKAAQSNTSPVNSLIHGLTSLKTMLISKIKSTFISLITNEVSEGIKQFALYSASFNTAMSNMMNGGKQLAGNIASLMANIISVVEPVITRILSLFNTLITTVSAFFAKLTGKKTISVAKKQTGSYADTLKDTAAAGKEAETGTDTLEDAADAAKDAAKEQKKYNAELYGWDELTRQSAQEDTSAGSDITAPKTGDLGDLGDIDAGGGGMEWVEVPVDDILGDWENIDWFQMGYDWAEKIADALDKIPWGSIKAAAGRLGTNLADLLNGVFANLHFANSLGTTIAEVLNTGLTFALKFLERFNFAQFGKWSGTLWNAFVNAFEFEKLASVIALGGNGIIDALRSFFDTVAATCSRLGGGIGQIFNSIFVGIDFSHLADMILSAVNDINIALNGFNNTIKWDEAALNIRLGINKLISGMKISENGSLVNVWAENGTEIGRLVGGFLTSLSDVFANIDFATLGSNLALAVQNIFNEVPLSEIINNFVTGFGQIGQGIVNFISGVDWGAIRDALVGGINTALQNFDAAVSTTDWSGLVTTLIGGLCDTISMVDWGTVTNILGEAIGGVISGLGTLISGADWAGAGASLGQCLNNLVSGINWSKFGTDLANGLNGGIKFLDEAIKNFDWFGLMYNIGTMLSNAVTGIDWASIGQLLSDGLGSIIDGLTGYLEGVDWIQLGYSIFNGLLDMLGNIDWIGLIFKLGKLLIDLFAGAVKLLGGALAGLFEGTVDAIWDIGKNIIEGLFGGIGEKITGVGDWLKAHLVDPLVNGVKSLLGIASPSTVFSEIGDFLIQGLFSGISGAWGSITEFFGTAVEGIKTTLSGAWESIKTTASGAWEGIKGSLSEKWETIKASSSETWENIKGGISEKWTGIKSTVSESASNVKEKATTAWNAIKTNTSTAYSNIKSTIQSKFNEAKSAASTAITNMKSTALTGWSNMVSNAKTKFQEIYNNTKEKMSSVTSHLKGIQWGSIGSNLVSGLLSGLKSMWSSVTSWVSSAASSLTSTLRSAFSIHSPSRVWAEIGTFLDAGLVNGLEDGKRAIFSTVSNLAASVTDRMNGAGGTMSFSDDADITRLGLVKSSLSQIADIMNNIAQTLASMGGLQIPQIAAGTVIPYKTKIAADSEDTGYTGEAVYTPEILQILRNILEYLRSGSGQSGNISVSIDGREIFNVVVDENERAIGRTGRSPIRV